MSGFPGDPATAAALPEWYRPHVQWWARRATPETTLWLWNTEIGWANLHTELANAGWEYRSCHVWNKGPAHVAGNANSMTLRKFPVVTEVCVQYVKAPRFDGNGASLSMQAWLRREWERTGLPLHLANIACGVGNAATRKYLTRDHLWYYPPADAFERMVRYANDHGAATGRPYFSIDGRRSIGTAQWRRLRAKFHCEVGISNVWEEPPVRGPERVKGFDMKALHRNQKPLRLVELAIRASTDEGDVVWEPFGGLCPAAVAAHALRRRCVSAELDAAFFRAAAERLATYDTGAHRLSGATRKTA